MKSLVLAKNKVTEIKKNLIDGLSIASGSKSSATYYHNSKEQVQAIKNNVQKLYSLSKELPLLIANQKGVTGRYIQEVLLNEFKETTKGGACNIVNPIDWYDNNIGEKAILGALYKLSEDNGIPYVFRLFINLKGEKINNERSRKIILGFLFGHSNLEFISLKYRNKIREILKHVYGVRITSILTNIAKKYVNSNVYSNEKESNIANKYLLKYFNGSDVKAYKILLFLFKEDHNISYKEEDFPILSEYYKAKNDVISVSKVPEEVLIGLLSDETHPQYNDLWSTEEKRKTTIATLREKTKVTSINQQVRQTKSNEKLGVKKDVDVSKATDFLALYKTGYENGWNDDLRNAIDNLAENKKIDSFLYDNIGIIIDDSNSMFGHKKESKNTPKAIVDFTSKVLSKSANNGYVTVKTEGEVTDLASAFVKLLKKENDYIKFDAIFILTDGYENSYDGLLNEVLNVYFKETNRNLPIFQISPITGAEMGGDVRKLGSNVVTMTVNDPVSIQPQINSRLLEIDTLHWLENQILAIEETNVSRKLKNVVKS